MNKDFSAGYDRATAPGSEEGKEHGYNTEARRRSTSRSERSLTTVATPWLAPASLVK